MGLELSVFTQADLKAYAAGLLEPEEEREIRALLRTDVAARGWVEFYRKEYEEADATENSAEAEARRMTKNGSVRRVLNGSMVLVAAMAVAVLTFGPEILP